MRTPLPNLSSAVWDWTFASARHTGAQTNTALVTPGSGKRIFIQKIIVSRPSVAIDAQITEGNDAAGTRLLDVNLAATTGTAILEFPETMPYAMAADAVLRITTDTGNVSTCIWYVTD